MNPIIAYACAILCLLAVSAFFSAGETAYAAASRLRLKAAAETGSRRAKLAYRLHESFDRVLIAILIGNNLANIAASALATTVALLLLGEGGAWVAAPVMALLIVTFGEALPKIASARDAERRAISISVPLAIVSAAFFPLVWLAQKLCDAADKLWKGRMSDKPAVTEDDLETIFDTVEDEGVIDEERADLLQSALDFDEVLAYEILTPRVDMLAVDADDPVEDVLEEIMDAPFSRIPVYRDTVDHIIGILHLNHVLKELVEERSLEIDEIMLPPVFVHKTMPLPDVLKVMKRKKSHLVIVTDEYGGTMGLLTMEDVLEQLVGDIWDESDEVENEFIPLGNNRYDVDADIRLEDFFDQLELDERGLDEDNTTLGGWTTAEIGRYPRVGDSFDYQNITVTVKKREKLRVIRLLVTVRPPIAEEDER